MEIDIVRRRLANQRLSRSTVRNPADVVAWLGAVQAQDYSGAKWAIGLRANGIGDTDVERACDEGAILRTHVLRPTWHFVSPADIRWMLALTAPRVHAASAYSYRQSGLDARVVARSRKVLERALRGGKQLTRTELAAVLKKAGVPSAGPPLGHVMMHAELDALVCSGARRGKQFTYALLEERVPRVRALTREQALAELTRRYFASHGPATLRDYVWWSGLTARDARAGIALLGSLLVKEALDDHTCWSVPSRVRPGAPPFALLLPNYDEYLIAYKDRESVLDPRRPPAVTVPTQFSHHVVIDGRVRGSWSRTLGGKGAGVAARLLTPPTRDERGALAAEAARYATFLAAPVTLSYDKGR